MSDRPLLRRDLRADRRADRRRRHRKLRALSTLVIGAILISVTLQAFVVRGFYVPSSSMMPTLTMGDRVLVDELTPRFTGYHQGDIVVFHDPGDWLESFGLNDYLVKRIIAVGGDTIQGLADGTVIVNGRTVDEPWTASQQPFEATVPAGELWVMGDNRSNSADSRFHGTVPVSDVVGRVFVVYWPLDRWGSL
jgi:signal peptidase I